MYHKTAEGRKLLIAQMTDIHLTNTINLMCKNYNEYKKLLGMTVTLEMKLMGIKNDQDATEGRMSQILLTLPFYIYEATLRGLDFTEILQSTIERKESIPDITWPSIEYDEDWLEDNDHY